MGALRLKDHFYAVQGRKEGLDFSLREKGLNGYPAQEYPYSGPAPGFDLDDSGTDLKSDRVEETPSGLAPPGGRIGRPCSWIPPTGGRDSRV